LVSRLAVNDAQARDPEGGIAAGNHRLLVRPAMIERARHVPYKFLAFAGDDPFSYDSGNATQGMKSSIKGGRY
jgi:hypothetical protein